MWTSFILASLLAAPGPEQLTLTYQAESASPDAMNQAVELIRKRLEATSNPASTIEFTDETIQVTVDASADDIERIKRTITSRGIELHPVSVGDEADAAKEKLDHELRALNDGMRLTEDQLAKLQFTDSNGQGHVWAEHGMTETGAPRYLLLQSPAPFAASDIKELVEDVDYRGMPALRFTLHDNRADDFRAFTSQLIDHRLAVVVDGRVLSAPTIVSPLSHRGLIEGGSDGLSDDQVENICQLHKIGSLPVELKLLSEKITESM